MRTTPLLLLAALSACPALGQTPQLIKDLNTQFRGDSQPRNLVWLGSAALFDATTPQTGRELWRTDGTPAGTSLLKETQPGPLGGVSVLGVVNGRAIFGAAGGLWSSDGATDTKKIASVSPRRVARNWRSGSFRVFAGVDTGGEELWRTNGTAAGTSKIIDLNTSRSSSPRHLHAVTWKYGSTIHEWTFFVPLRSTNGAGQLWRTDGTAAGTRRLTSLSSTWGDPVHEIAHAVDSQGRLTVWFTFYTGSFPKTRHALYRMQFASPAANPTMALLTPPSLQLAASSAPILAAVGERAYFAANGGLWTNTASSLSVSRVTSLSSVAAPTGLFAAPGISGSVFFQASSFLGRELYRVVGTSASLVRDIHVGAASSNPYGFVASSRFVYFAATDAAHGTELWRTDGTAAGTQLVLDASPGTASGVPHDVAARSLDASTDLVVFAARHPQSGEEPHVFREGGAKGLLKNLFTPDGTQGSDPSRYFEHPSGEVWFTTRVNSSFDYLWRTDGTSAGTARVQGVLTSPTEIVSTDDWNGYFSAYHRNRGVELWVTDGKTAPKIVKDLYPGRPGSNPRDLAVCAGRLFHAATDPDHGEELCREGEHLFDLVPGKASSRPRDLVRAGNFLFFSASSATRGRELWAYQWRGKPGARPYLVRDIRPGAASSDPRSLVAFRNRVYFTADDGVHGRELWRSVGNGSQTILVKDVQPGAGSGVTGELYSTGNVLFFVGDDGTTGRELWLSNGFSGAGTRLVADMRPGSAGLDPKEITPVHFDRVAFVGDDGVHGEELWLATGTAGRRLDLVAGPTGSKPRGLFWSSDDLYFTAETAAAGREPWVAAGIDLASPRMLGDVFQGGSSSMLATDGFAIAENHVVFTADDGVHGREPWSVPAGAISRRVGQGCGGEARTPALWSTAPKIGGNIQLSAFGIQNVPSSAFLVASARPSGPLKFGECHLQLDVLTLVSVGDPIPVKNNFVVVIPIPNDSKLLGKDLSIGVFVGPSSDPELGFDYLNTVELRVGR